MRRRVVWGIAGIALLLLVLLAARRLGEREPARDLREAPRALADERAQGTRPGASRDAGRRALTRAPTGSGGPARYLSPATTEGAPDIAGGSFEGRVVASTDGRAVAAASLTFVHDGASRSVTTASDGTFRFAAPQPGVYELVLISAEGFLPYAAELGDAAPRLVARAGVRVSGLVLALHPRVMYTARVLDPRGQPVADAEVRVSAAGAPVAQGADRVRTGADGEARIAAPDGALVSASRPGFAPARALVDFAAQASHRLTLRLGDVSASDAGEASGSIAGRVLDAQGQGVEGAVVIARFEEQDARRTEFSLRTLGRATSEPDGRFVLEALDPGTYAVSASHAESAPGEASGVRVGTRDLELRLAAGGSVHGSVRDGSSNAPVAAFTVVLAARRGALERSGPRTYSVFDAEGRYELRGIAPGPYVLTVVAHGYAPAPEASVDVPGSEGAGASADFTLTRGGRVVGQVVDRVSGQALRGARVSLEARGEDDEALPGAVSRGASTDGDGRFELGGLAPGLHSVVFAAEGHHGRILSGLAVPADGELGPLRVELTPTAPGEEPRLELVGIGAVLSARGDVLNVESVLPGGGAAEVGIQPGDGVLAVDGEPAQALGYQGAIERIRGPEGSVVQLTIRRGGADGGRLELAVPRRRIAR